MPELQIVPDPPLAERRRSLRTALASIVPGWRPWAEGILGADERIDWIGLDRVGRAVVVLLADRDEDLALVARGIAQRDWVESRLGDWSQLAPEVGLRPDAGVRLVLIAPRFRPAALAAVRALPDSSVLCAVLRFLHNQSEVVPLLELVGGSAPQPLRSDAAPAAFRSGLTDEDLDLSPGERAEFDDLPERGSA